MRRFPPASQPQIMRAAEKDEYYVSYLCEACHDAFRHAFGTRLAMSYENESRLAGCVLYYLLTTGAGLQTLGEEYCDITQVEGSSRLPLAPARRTLLVFFQSILPYLAERLSAKVAARGVFLSSQNAEGPEANAVRVDVVQSYGASPAQSERFTTGPSSGTGGISHMIQNSRLQRLQRIWFSGLQRWPRVLPYVRDAFLLVVRGNLMFFYFEGVYFHLAKRAAGVQYAHMGKAFYKKPRYHMLGMFLLIQLGIVMGDWLRQNALPALANSMRMRTIDQSFSSGGQRCAMVLDADGNRMTCSPEKQESTALNNFISSNASSKCSLCLSPRQHPTSTLCGHVFCWKCIAEWCNEKLECPLCRSPVLHSDLICIYHADF